MSESIKEQIIEAVRAKIDGKFYGAEDEIISFIEDQDFDESFEEECDELDEASDALFEELQSIDRVTPRVNDVGGPRVNFEHSYDKESGAYHFKSYVTFDTGYGGSIMKSIEVDLTDPENLYVTSLETEDECIMDHERFLEHLEELTGESFEDHWEIESTMNEFEELDDEENLARLKEAIVTATKDTVRDLGILDLNSDAPEAIVEFTIEIAK